jgi:hypothetical protein
MIVASMEATSIARTMLIITEVRLFIPIPPLVFNNERLLYQLLDVEYKMESVIFVSSFGGKCGYNPKNIDFFFKTEVGFIDIGVFEYEGNLKYL